MTRPGLHPVALVALAIACSGAVAGALTANDFKGKNIVLFLSDQERATQNFPAGWEEKNLPGLMRLKRNGVTFKKAYTNACMCSPARSALFTGFLPAQTGVHYTLEQSMPDTLFPNVELPLPEQLPNMATMAAAAGYSVVYKGKFHINKPANADYTWTPSDLSEYGFKRWNGPDSGANQSLSEGGGNPLGGGNNDYRYMRDDGAVSSSAEGVLAYINNVAKAQQPFFLVISLVNPHDVLFYPNTFASSGYDPSLLTGDILVPGSYTEDMSTKPAVQAQYTAILNGTSTPNPSSINTTEEAQQYVNFYANLIKETDGYLVETLDALQTTGLLDDTVVIRSSDHGEAGLAHGGMRQKNFNMYEQSTNIPLVYSNPKLYPAPLTSDALVSHIDLVPTLATLLGTPRSSRIGWEGVDYSSIVLNPKTAKPVQDYVVFTYDDFQSGQSNAQVIFPDQPNHVVAIHESRYKFAKYYDPSQEYTKVASEYEMYDLKTDPAEIHNLAYPGFKRSAVQEREYQRLRKKLSQVQATRLAPLPLARAVALTGAVKNVKSNGTTAIDTGSVQGVPVGAPYPNTGGGAAPSITLTYQLGQGTATNTFIITSPVGIIRGRATMTYSVSGNDIAFTGTAELNDGTGAFRGIKAKGLAFHDTNTLDGQNGSVTINGTAFY